MKKIGLFVLNTLEQEIRGPAGQASSIASLGTIAGVVGFIAALVLAFLMICIPVLKVVFHLAVAILVAGAIFMIVFGIVYRIDVFVEGFGKYTAAYRINGVMLVVTTIAAIVAAFIIMTQFPF